MSSDLAHLLVGDVFGVDEGLLGGSAEDRRRLVEADPGLVLDLVAPLLQAVRQHALRASNAAQDAARSMGTEGPGRDTFVVKRLADCQRSARRCRVGISALAVLGLRPLADTELLLARAEKQLPELLAQLGLAPDDLRRTA